jgi:hypothetical protein
LPLVSTGILGFGGGGAAKLIDALLRVLDTILLISIPSSSLALAFFLFVSLISKKMRKKGKNITSKFEDIMKPYQRL